MQAVLVPRTMTRSTGREKGLGGCSVGRLEGLGGVGEVVVLFQGGICVEGHPAANRLPGHAHGFLASRQNSLARCGRFLPLTILVLLCRNRRCLLVLFFSLFFLFLFRLLCVAVPTQVGLLVSR